MKILTRSLASITAAALLASGLSYADSPKPRPVHVLYVAPEKSDVAAAQVACAKIMEDLGREAIYLDFLSEGASKKFTDDDAAHYDLIITADQAKDATTLRKAVEDKVRPEVLSAWRQFVEAREPEKREPHPQVANYEKRPQTVTFQHPFSPKGSMERTQVPADMKLQLFAKEPDIVKPIAFAWDERGRLWVAETRDYPHGHNESGEGNDDIKICEDTDGDGVADRFTIFADHLNIPTSITFANGGIIVAQPPKFIFLKSSKGDDHADIRKEILAGWGIGDTHGQAGNLHYGYDNWLYGSVGYDGFDGEVGGKKVKFTMGTYRFKADGSALEFLHQFTNNTWAHSTNQYGDQFGGTANGAPIFFGGIPHTVVPEGPRFMTAKKINVVDPAHAITPNYRQVDVFGNYDDSRHWGGYTAACGSNFIYSKNMPARLQGKAMVCEPTMKIISLMDVKPDGAGYKADDSMNLVASSDEWHSPVYAEVGPDGAVWYADWANFIIQHNPTPSMERGGFKGETGPGGAHKNDLRDHERGRIYRVVWDKATKPAITSLAGASDEQLVAALSNDTQFWRLKAQQMIVEGKRSGTADALKKIVLANDGSIAAIHALWSLHGLGALDEVTHKAALLAKDAGLRRNAIRALGADKKAHDLFFGSGGISDPDLNTRLAAFVKLAEFPTTPEVQTLVKRLSTDKVTKEDEWLKEAARVLGRVHKATSYKEGPNLLVNGDLEKIGADGFPEGWKRRDYGKAKGNAKAEWKVVSGPNESHSGHALRCITRDDADTSFFQEVTVKPNTEYRLSGWVRAHGLKGKISFNDHIGRAETEKITRDSKGLWQEVEVTFNSGKNTKSSVNILHVAKGDGYFDDVKLVELIPDEDAADKVLAGDAKRGENIFWNHPVAACKNCHMLKGVGSTVGPPLDGIALRQNEAYITQSLIEPNAVLAKGYEYLKISPMPPMGLILKPQELADVKAFILTLKEPLKTPAPAPAQK